jgi:hypothetical protein
MATLTLENVPETLLQALSQAAEQSRRSFKDQALHWLEQKAGHWSGCQERERVLRQMCRKYEEIRA